MRQGESMDEFGKGTDCIGNVRPSYPRAADDFVQHRTSSQGTDDQRSVPRIAVPEVVPANSSKRIFYPRSAVERTRSCNAPIKQALHSQSAPIAKKNRNGKLSSTSSFSPHLAGWQFHQLSAPVRSVMRPTSAPNPDLRILKTEEGPTQQPSKQRMQAVPAPLSASLLDLCSSPVLDFELVPVSQQTRFLSPVCAHDLTRAQVLRLKIQSNARKHRQTLWDPRFILNDVPARSQTPKRCRSAGTTKCKRWDIDRNRRLDVDSILKGHSAEQARRVDSQGVSASQEEIHEDTLVTMMRTTGKAAEWYYLPKELQGVSVMSMITKNSFRADNTRLQATTRGLCYRKSKNILDKASVTYDDDLCLAWGSSMEGTDEGDGWIRVRNKMAQVSTEEGNSNDAFVGVPVLKRPLSKSKTVDHLCQDHGEATNADAAKLMTKAKRATIQPRRASTFPRTSIYKSIHKLPVRELAIAEAVYGKLSRGGEISSDDILLALTQVGVMRSYSTTDVTNDVSEMLEEVFDGRSFLDKAEFFEVVQTIYGNYWSRVHQMFQEANADLSGTLGTEELSCFLKKHHITPLPELIKDLQLELLGIEESTKLIGVNEFVKLLDIIYDRAGFTRAEADELDAVYVQFANTRDSTIETWKHRRIFAKLGFSTEYENLRSDIGSALDKNGFLQFVRKCSEYKLEQLRRAIGGQGPDERGCISVDALTAVFAALGYMSVSRELISEMLVACEMQRKKGFNFLDVHQLLKHFHDIQGFLISELEEIQNAFAKFEDDLSHPDGISGVELTRAVMWLGFPANARYVKNIVLQLELADRLESRDFLKVVGRVRDDENSAIRKAFLTTHPDSGHRSRMTMGELRALLKTLCYNTTCDIWESFSRANGGDCKEVDSSEADTLVVKFREEARDRLRSREGFTDKEYEEIEKDFAKRDKLHLGYLSHKPLRSLLDRFFPNIKRSLQDYQAVQAILREVDKDRNGQLEFPEFLYLMRLIQNHSQKESMIAGRIAFKKEKAAINTSKFTLVEVNDFRHAFKIYAKSDSNGIHPAAFEDMIEKILAGNGSRISASVHLADIVKTLMKSVSKDLDHQLDFPEFLCIMRKILDEVFTSSSARPS